MAKLIAELCQNHLGSRDTLSEMIAAVAESGAHYVKMQTIFSADLTQRERFEAGAVEDNGVRKTIQRPYQAEFDRLQQLDLTEDDHVFFIEECQRHGVLPMTTVFNRSRIPFAGSLPWPERIVKVASYDCASYPLLRELCEHFDTLVVSTGGTFDDEIEHAAAAVHELGKEIVLLHCVTSYPNTLAMCNFDRMAWLKQFTNAVGWSDHTLVERDGIQATKAAIALGAEWIERHFTILAKDETKDGPVSITPALLKELSAFAALPPEEQQQAMQAEFSPEEWIRIRGSATRELTHQEMLNRDYYRGRFASRAGNKWIYNWEEGPLS